MKLRLSSLLVLIFAAMMLAGGPLPGHAQAPQIVAPPGLNLSPAQQARAKTRQQQFVKDITALQADKTMTPAQKTAKAKTIFQARDADMMAILTPQQRAQVLAQRKSAVDQRATFFKTHQAEITAGSTLANKLNKSLSAAQKSQIAGIRKHLTAQGQGLGSNHALSPQAKQQQWQSDQQAAQTKILAILKPTQKSDYLKMQQMQKHLMSEAGTGQPSR